MAANVVKELVVTEAQYVKKLHLLSEIFRKRVHGESVLSEKQQSALFANIACLYKFHNSHLFPQLLTAAKAWRETRSISFVINDLAPWFKMYSNYSTSYASAIEVFKKAKKHNPRFAAIVAEIEKLPVCGGLALQEHFICPVQRVTKYELLLKEYHKHLTEYDSDYDDTILALTQVLDAASHANETLRRWEGFQYLVQIQKELKDSVFLVSAGRELIRKGKVRNASWTDCKNGSLTIHLYTDLVILVGEKKERETSSPLGSQILGTQRFIYLFYPQQTVLSERNETSPEHAFCIRDLYKLKCYVQVICENEREYDDWYESLSRVINDRSEKNFACPKIKWPCTQSPCKHFGLNQTFITNPHLNIRFNTSVNNGLRRSQSTASFYMKATSGLRRTKTMLPKDIHRAENVESNRNVMFAEWVTFEGEKRYVKIKDDCHLYIYNKSKDSRAIAKLPLPGCNVTMDYEPSIFHIRVQGKEYKLTCTDPEVQTTILDLIANAQFTTHPT